MKHIFSILFLLSLTANSIFAQKIGGAWQGNLNIMGNDLKLIFNINKTNDKLNATLDVPQQGAENIPATISFSEQKELVIKVDMAGIEYRGIVVGDSIKGEYKQGTFKQELILKKSTKGGSTMLKRPQTPKAPFPYREEMVKFKNKKANNIQLAGTLTMAKTQNELYPVVILVSGSGPQNRDEEVFGHKPFAVLSDYLTRQNIGVLRFDDRGCFESEGDFANATTADFATDVEAAIDFLLSREDIDKKNIFLIGHSEGAIIASMVAARRKDIKGIVLLAGTGVRGDEVLIEQTVNISRLMNLPKEKIEEAVSANKRIFKLIIENNNNEKLADNIKPLVESIYDPASGIDKELFVKQQMQTLLSPWFQFFIKHNPANDLESVKCPVLALNGEKDMQVDAEINLKVIEDVLVKGGNKKVTVKKYLHLNHLFQNCQTGALSEYATIEETFSPLVMEDISKWIFQESKK